MIMKLQYLSIFAALLLLIATVRYFLKNDLTGALINLAGVILFTLAFYGMKKAYKEEHPFWEKFLK